jgi:hypothetical protein
VRPEDVLCLLASVVPDVEEHEGVALAHQVVHRPLQRLLAARREVHRHADPPLGHGDSPSSVLGALLSVLTPPVTKLAAKVACHPLGFVMAVSAAARGQLDARTVGRASRQTWAGGRVIVSAEKLRPTGVYEWAGLSDAGLCAWIRPITQKRLIPDRNRHSA